MTLPVGVALALRLSRCKQRSYDGKCPTLT